MSLVHSPPPEQAGEAPSVSSQTEEIKCSICENPLILDTQECYKLTTCGHVFHKICIEQSLSSAADCPTCKVPCQLSDLRNCANQPIFVTDNASQTGTTKKNRHSFRGKARGVMGTRPQTRSLSRNLFTGNENANNSLDLSPRPANQMVEAADPFSPAHNSRPVRLPPFSNANQDQGSSGLQHDNSIGIDYERINQMIENSLTRMLQGMNLQSSNAPNRSQPQAVNQGNVPPPRAANQNEYRGNNSHNISFNHSDSSSIRLEKIPSIIRNWNIRFDGTKNGLTVDEFIYRISSMTQQQLNGDFEITCNNLQVLLFDKALHWYWRYHKKVNSIKWEDFCVALKCEFKDMRSTYDIREELRNRKMRPGETFESFYDSICLILDHLETPMVEAELVEILVRNLSPDIRHELLYVPVYSIAHLRKLVQMRENLLTDAFYRKNMVAKPHQASQATGRRHIAEVKVDDESEIEFPNTVHVDAVDQNTATRKCWNCDQPGHFWDDCVRERTIFCYGCGTKNVYKPQCSNCINRKHSASKNYQRPNSTTSLS